MALKRAWKRGAARALGGELLVLGLIAEGEKLVGAGGAIYFGNGGGAPGLVARNCAFRHREECRDV